MVFLFKYIKKYMKTLRKKFPIIDRNPYLAIFIGLSFSVFIVGLIFFSFIYLFSGTEVVVAAVSEGQTIENRKSIIEVHIANNGMVYLQGAVVESVSGSKLVVSTTWNNTKLEWGVNTNGSDYGKRHFGTQFSDSKGEKLTIADIRVGSVISVNGIFETGDVGLTVKADFIRKIH